MRLLCVEDEAPLREDIAEYLRMMNYEVDEAEDGEDAIAQMNRHNYDLVLCDIKMPRMDGYDLLRQVRSEDSYAKTPFLFLTAYGERDNRIRANEGGCDGYLTKPVDFSVLDSTIRAQIDRQRARDFISISMLECTRKHVMSAIDDAMNGAVANAMIVTDHLAGAALTESERSECVMKLKQYLATHLQGLQQFYTALHFQTAAPSLQVETGLIEALIHDAVEEAHTINPASCVRYVSPLEVSSQPIKADLQLLRHALAGLIAQMPHDYPSNKVVCYKQREECMTITLCDLPSMIEDTDFVLVDGTTDLVALSSATRKRLIALSFAMQTVQAHRGWLEVKINADDELAVRFQLPQWQENAALPVSEYTKAWA